mmetsp:Transcript_64051/g.187408  ORF Transcript_64051/g.187408 Transcript_64051/m.187408 type:complete len:205 (+) Transcript_64051:1381-1995(+)
MPSDSQPTLAPAPCAGTTLIQHGHIGPFPSCRKCCTRDSQSFQSLLGWRRTRTCSTSCSGRRTSARPGANLTWSPTSSRAIWMPTPTTTRIGIQTVSRSFSSGLTTPSMQRRQTGCSRSWPGAASPHSDTKPTSAPPRAPTSASGASCCPRRWSSSSGLRRRRPRRCAAASRSARTHPSSGRADGTAILPRCPQWTSSGVRAAA